MKVITASLKHCKKFVNNFDQCMSEYRVGGITTAATMILKSYIMIPILLEIKVCRRTTRVIFKNWQEFGAPFLALAKDCPYIVFMTTCKHISTVCKHYYFEHDCL